MVVDIASMVTAGDGTVCSVRGRAALCGPQNVRTVLGRSNVQTFALSLRGAR